ncbi:MAG: O-antigen ligase family protein [Candidatus Paceibacterota bacterium]
MQKHFTKLNLVFLVELVVFTLIIFGVLPRETATYLVVFLAGYVLFASLEDSVVLFVRSIPLFLAIPITENFDQLNTWRIVSGLIFLQWLLNKEVLRSLMSGFTKFWKAPFVFLKNHQVLAASSILLLLAVLSAIQAPSQIIALKRIIYFINLALIGIIIYDLAIKNRQLSPRLIKNIAVPTIIVTAFGFVQLAMTYLMDVYQFMRLWGEGIECNLFGNQWCYIAVNVGHTWLAYFGEQLSLRMFSLFPDSHSFPIFLLLGLPAIFAWILPKVMVKKESLKSMFKTKPGWISILVPLILLATILSGTRGIWAASLGAILMFLLAIYLFKKMSVDIGRKNIFKYISSSIVIFFLLFVIAYPIFASPQFLVSKGDSLILRQRVKSIIDFGETSNSQRIEIWKSSISSIVKKPLLGVGIGNFPVVLNQDLVLARAGSSAHNIYLHVAAEMGILALLAALWFIWLLLRKVFFNFLHAKDTTILLYNSASLIFITWVMFYSLTDVALFDERAFLLFITTVAIIFSYRDE